MILFRWDNFKNTAYGSYKPKNGQRLEEFANAVRLSASWKGLVVVDLYHNSGITPGNVFTSNDCANPAPTYTAIYPYPDYTKYPSTRKKTNILILPMP